jgi:steroid 5-alpha reductase family enzyme
MIIQILFECTLLLFVYMSGCFIIAHFKKDNSIIDIAWGFGFMLIAWFSFVRTHAFLARHILITGLITVWALRLSGYLLLRNWGKKEDIRYTQMKKKWGRLTPLYSFFIVFMLQGFLILVIGYPILIINISSVSGLTLLDFAGIALWIVGFLFETIGDWQLYLFLQKPINQNKIMMEGLWRCTRHPNYFGEAVLWWGVWLIAITVPYGLSAIISPLTITYLLLYVSGVPLAERYLQQLEGFDSYKSQTNMFIPWFVKKES